MRKAISYALFGVDKPYYKFYERGLFQNIRMNALIYPEWDIIVNTTFIESVSIAIHEFDYKSNSKILFNYYIEPRHCEGMLWRLEPLKEYDYVIMRDADAITTWREKRSVDRWINSGRLAHGINDAKPHSIPMMGGMIGLRGGTFANQFNYDASSYDLTQHGADQNFIMDHIYPKVQHSFYLDKDPETDYTNPLWESDLVCKHIGSAGYNEMELTRFFRKFESQEVNKRNEEILKKYFNEIL